MLQYRKLRKSAVHALFPLLSSAIFFASFANAAEEVLYTNDFSLDFVGEKPMGFDHVRPSGANIGEFEPFPISWQPQDGPVGALIVGSFSQPAPSFSDIGNQSLRIYDYSSGGSDPRAYVAKNFVPDAINNRADVRVDLKFQRSTAIPRDPEYPGDVLMIGLGEFASGLSFHQGSSRAITFLLTNEGGWETSGTPETQAGTYNADAVNTLTLIANSHPENALTYDGPQGTHTIPSFTYSAYLNGARILDGHPFSNQYQLGKLAFMTGLGSANVHVDFLIDDLRIAGLRETEIVEFVLDYDEDFNDQTIGNSPSGSFYARSSADGVGLEVVGPESAIPSIEGNSVRIHDQSSADRAALEDNFVPGSDSYRPDIRFDFSFRRTAASELTGSNNVLYASLGDIGSGLSLHTNSSRALEVRIGNDGTIRSGGTGTSSSFQFEEFNEIGVHHVSLFANAQEDSVSYNAPDGQLRNLDGHSFSVFLNGEILDENRGFRTNDDGILQLPNLGRWGFVTGVNNASTGIDFVIDNIRVSQFLNAQTPADLPPLRIAQSETAGKVTLSWESAPGVNYRLHQSDDLQTWTPLEETHAGNGETLEVETDIADTPRKFFRLQIED